MARLVVVAGKRTGASLELGTGTVAVGRLASCELPIDEPQASRRHFEITARDGVVHVKDLGSKNGTYLNEGRLDGEAELQDGDRLRVGATVVAFEAARPPFPKGTRIGPYELGEVVERRPGLVLHEGRHASLARNVVVEVLEAGAPRAAAFLARARASSAYDHPALLAVFDAGEHEGRTYRVREAVSGPQELEARLREGKLPPPFALNVAAQVAAGLAHIHEQGGVHGWITPRVILVDDAATVKVEVVGGDRLLRLDPQRRDARLQTLSISPEEARGLDPVAESDVYALGCVLHRALTGVAPYDGELAQVIRGHGSEGPVAPISQRVPELEGPISKLVSGLLAKRPADRPKAAVVARELERLAAGAARTRSRSKEPPSPPVELERAGPAGDVPKPADEVARSTARPDSARSRARAEAPDLAAGRRAGADPGGRRTSSAERRATLTEPPSEVATPEEAEDEDLPDEEPVLAPARPRGPGVRAFDPLRGAFLGAACFLLFVVAAEGTRFVLRFFDR